MLAKSRKSQGEIEKLRSIRVEKNLQKKREEKGLLTVVESMNETDPNKTNAQKDTSKTRANKQNREVIAEESMSDRDSDNSYSTIY